MIYIGLLAMMFASDLTKNDSSALLFNPPYPPDRILVVGNGKSGLGWKIIFHVEADGRIILGPSASLDEASLAFWQTVDQVAGGRCQQAVDEQKKGRP